MIEFSELQYKKIPWRSTRDIQVSLNNITRWTEIDKYDANTREKLPLA